MNDTEGKEERLTLELLDTIDHTMTSENSGGLRTWCSSRNGSKRSRGSKHSIVYRAIDGVYVTNEKAFRHDQRQVYSSLRNDSGHCGRMLTEQQWGGTSYW
jgi:hypothetical protein